jgi:hypothetical protein
MTSGELAALPDGTCLILTKDVENPNADKRTKYDGSGEVTRTIQGHKLREAWRVFRYGEGLPRTLFHGVNGSRTLPCGEVLKAERRIVQNPGKKGVGRRYISGWHIVPSREAMTEYLKRFKAKDLIVCRVWVDEFRDKPGSKVKLAKLMYISPKDWLYAQAVRYVGGSAHECL